MRKTKNYIITLLILTILLLSILIVLFMSSSINDDKTESYNSKTTINIMNNWGDSSDKNAVLTEVIKTYTNSNPDILINNNSLSDGDFYLRLQTDFASANEPDIIITYADQNMKNLYKSDKLATFNEALTKDNEWQKTIRKDTLIYTTDNGNIWGIPTDVDYIALYTNTELFDAFSLSIPKTLWELKYVISVFKSNGITPIAFSSKDENLLMYQAIVSSYAGRLELNKAISRSGSRDCYSQGLQILKDLYNANAFPSNCNDILQTEAQELFLSGKAAMIVETSSFAGVADKRTTESKHFDISVFPAIRENRYRPSSEQTNYVGSYPTYRLIPYSVGSSTFFISKQAYETKKEAVLDLIKHLTSPEVSRQFYIKTKYISSISDTNLSDKNSPLITERNLLISAIDEFTDMPQNGTNHFIWHNTISSNIANVLIGTIAPEELWNSAEESLKIIEH